MTAESHNYPVCWVGSQAVIAMPDEIDSTNADQVLQALLSAARPGVRVLVIDMTKTRFCDSAGVHAVITAYREAAGTGTQLRLAATAVQRIFKVIGADQLMPIYPALGAALAGTADGQPGPPSQPGPPDPTGPRR
jgi:anti-sigma B factor antagonist